jgi:RNA polymerase sigma-B factor
LLPLLADLAAPERNILLLRFYANMSQSRIADRIGISHMHVSRLLSYTLDRLRRRIDISA